MTRQQIEAIGRNGALEAIDQAASFRGVSDAIDNYFENLADTLVELGVPKNECRWAFDAFEAVLVRHEIAHRPNGL
jgi:hypothetical protein